MLPTFKNINDFFKTRPPMVIFFICLVTLMVASFSFAFYVKHTDQIVNSDVKENWESLTRYLNNTSLCVNNSAENYPRYVETTSFSSLISANLTQFEFDNGTTITAYYDLRGWRPHCPDITGDPSFLTVTFDISDDNDRICGVIKGPERYLSHGHAYSCDSNKTNERMSDLVLHSCSGTNLDGVKLLFNSSDIYETYLTQADKGVIYVHLIWSGYILSFCVLIMLISAMFSSSDYLYIKNKTFEN